MTLDALFNYAVVFASTAVGSFVLAVILDDLLGVLLAVKGHTFDAHKLPDFLGSQFGTKEAAALAGIVATAVSAAAAAALIHGGLTADALRVIADAGFAAATAGAAAMLLAVVSDIYGKVGQLLGVAPAKPA